MAKPEKKEKPVIIIKKGGHDDHDDHHGGAWKVAYADFVTAMMAFFLLLWILNAVDDQTLQGIAEYFTPTLVERGMIGGDGVLQGTTIGPPGALNSSTAPMMTVATPRIGRDDPGRKEEVETPAEDAAPAPQRRQTISDSALAEAAEARDEARFSEAETRIVQAMQQVPDLKPLLQNVLFDRTPEGLRIQVVDQEGQSMFPLASARMYDRTRSLLALVGAAVSQLPNDLLITGHTDALPFAKDSGTSGYGNWELSADRANATRRVLLEAGVPEARIIRVSGVAYRDPLDAKNPNSPVNRRISIVLMYGRPGPADVDRGPPARR